MDNKISVGQTICLKPVGNMTRHLNGNILDAIREVKVTKVGRKYFYTDRFNNKKFSLEEMRDVSEYSAEWKVYLSKQDIIDEIECDKLAYKIRCQIGSYGKTNLTLDQLRRINEIIS